MEVRGRSQVDHPSWQSALKQRRRYARSRLGGTLDRPQPTEKPDNQQNKGATKKMVTAIVPEETDVLLEADLYNATLVGVQTKESKGPAPAGMEASDAYWQWKFRIDEPGADYDGTEVYGTSSCKLTMKAKARTWVEALMLRGLIAGEEVNFEHMEGDECQVKVIVVAGEKGDRNKVEDVMRRKGAKTVELQSAPSVKPRLVPPQARSEDFDLDEPTDNEGVATEKQLKAIYAFGRANRRFDEDQVDDHCAVMFGVKPAELTKAEASQYIDVLKGEVPARELDFSDPGRVGGKN